MSVSKIYQKKLSEAVRLATSGDTLEVSKSIVYYVKHVLTQESIKRELKLDFDKIEIHPAQHSANTADVTLLKKGKFVGMINVKTCVSGNLRATLNAVRKTKRLNDDGLIIFGLTCTKSDNKVKRILGMIYINKKVLFEEPTDVIMSMIIEKLKKKQEDENCKELTPYSLNQMIALEGLVNSLKAYDMATEAKKGIDELKDRVSDIEKKLDKLDQIYEIVKKLTEDKK